MGASNLFLVRGKDIAAAIKATRGVFIGGRSADVPGDPEDGSKAETLWLVAYLGTAGSEPPAWLVKSALVRGQTVQISISTPERTSGTSDIHQYFVWVPLGELRKEMCTLELLNAEKGQLILSRNVNVVERK